MSLSYVSEDVFLKTFALKAFSAKYSKKISPEDCIIYSVSPSYGFKYGYEITTINSSDHFKLRLYFNLGLVDTINVIRLENESNMYRKNALGDEVYVITGEISTKYADSGIYNFRWLEAEALQGNMINFMNDDPFQFMDGDYMTWVEES